MIPSNILIRVEYTEHETKARLRRNEEVHIGLKLSGNRKHGDDVVQVFMCNVLHTSIDDDALGGGRQHRRIGMYAEECAV